MNNIEQYRAPCGMRPALRGSGDLPTSTFFNLRPEKQERLLTAAAREFAAQPFHEASINSMIRAAGIPRGSFYMYFRDKEELFQYLVRESPEPLLAFRELLTRSGGDLFDAIPGLCEYLRSHKADRGLGGMGMLSAIVERNGGLQKSSLIDLLDTQAVLAQLAAAVNPDLLDIWEASDLERIVRTVLTVALPLIYDAVHTETAESREELSKTLEILRRGMGAKPAAGHR